MLQKLREILLTQYIGSILVALVACNAAITLTATLLRAVVWAINDQRARSVLGSSRTAFAWDDLIYSAATAFLYLLIAYSLAHWLYPEAVVETDEGAEEQLVEP